MRKCYFTYDKIAGAVLIPSCWSVVHSNDITDCSCRAYPETFAEFDRKEYKEKLTKQNAYIIELEREITRLNEILINTENNILKK